MAFRVEISDQAGRDADSILEWLLSQDAGQAGIDWFLAFDDAFASLAEFPERCPIAPENTRFPFEVRQLLLTLKLRRGGQRAVTAVAHAQLIALYWTIRNRVPYPEQVQRLQQDRREAKIRYHQRRLTKLGYEPNRSA